ncbi:MAG: hypothetical protein KC635_19600 [Myxococcales bacterium]|nr:hypothetical protein [Myxococcales bacterium]MCB9733820.1 hypothetical protein [Deltaproteobacteria bacterium]
MKTLAMTLITMSLVTLAWLAPASASPPSAEDQERIGELHVSLANVEYVKVELDGDEYTATEFEKGGKLLLIKGIDLARETHTVKLIPFNETFAPKTVEVKATEFKKQRKGRIYLLVAKSTVKFDKASDAPKPPAEPDTAPEPTRPAPDKTDDL